MNVVVMWVNTRECNLWHDYETDSNLSLSKNKRV